VKYIELKVVKVILTIVINGKK